jgi:hypothetical protein
VDQIISLFSFISSSLEKELLQVAQFKNSFSIKLVLIRGTSGFGMGATYFGGCVSGTGFSFHLIRLFIEF